jgi:hypothetical protein
MHWIPLLGESPGCLFIGVVRGPVTMSERPPLTTSFTQSVQSHEHYSYFTLLTTLHRAYHMATRVPCDHAFIRHASLISGPLRPPLPSLSRPLNDSLCLHERLMPPFRSYTRRLVSNHKIPRSICGLMHVEGEKYL